MNLIKTNKHTIALIIPTRNRKQLLSLLLDSIEAQTRKPDQTILVDGSDEPLEQWLKSLSYSFQLTYVRVFPPSLTKQRNAGIGAINENISLVAYLDDDILLKKDAIDKMLMFWETCESEVGGASFNIINNPLQKNSLLQRVFLMRTKKQGAVLKTGFTTIAYPDDRNIETEWLCGGATVWRKTIVDKIKYDEWFAGTAYFEDVDFSYRAAKSYKLFALHEAQVEHNPPPFIPKNQQKLGEMEVTYRFYFVKKHFPKSVVAFYWSTAGQILANFVKTIIKLDSCAFYCTLGNIKGLLKSILRKLDKVETNFRASTFQLNQDTPENKA